MAACFVDGSRGRRRRARQRPAGARGQEGRRIRDLGANDVRVGGLRLRARPDRRDRRGRLPVERDERVEVHRRALGVRRGVVRGRGAAGEAGGPQPGAPARVRRPGRAAGTRAHLRARAARGAGGRRGGGRRGRPLHLHLHVGHDRPAQGLHDPAPQLLRDVPQRRGDRQLHEGRHAAAVPAAGAQLRPADASARPAPGLHDRVLPRPPRGGREAARGAPDRVPERAARLREGAHGCAGEVRRGDGHARSADRLGARRRAAGQRAAPARATCAARSGCQAPDRRPARLLEGEGASRRPAACRDLRRRTAGARGRRVLPRARHPHPRGLRADRVHHCRHGQPARSLPLRHRRAGHAGRRAEPGGRRRAAHLEPDRLRRLPQGRGGDARRARRGRVAAHRRRRRRSTTTAS